jgi:hypothetical protein
MSVDVEPPMLAAGLAPTHYAFLAGKGVVRITARKARELGMRVGPEPVKAILTTVASGSQIPQSAKTSFASVEVN